MEQWERERYLLHACSDRFGRRVTRATTHISNALRDHPGEWVVSFSGGKDSACVLDLCVRAGWHGPLLWQSYGDTETMPGNREMVEWAARHYDLEVIEHEAPGELEVYDEVGHAFMEATTPEERRAVRTWWDRSFREMEQYVRELGVTGMFWGMRIEESAARQKHLARRGPTYWVKDRGVWTCCPIWQWSGADVWAYLVSREIPWNPIYDAAGEDRERIRNDVVFLSGSGSIRHGQFAHWKRHAPELFAKLARKWPDIRTWV